MRIFLNIRILYRRFLRRSKVVKHTTNILRSAACLKCTTCTKFTCFIIVALLTAVACVIHLFTIGNSFYCLHWKTTSAIRRLCKLYENGLAVGDLCSDMCDGSNHIVVLSCYTSHLNKEFVITARWQERRVVIKSKYVDVEDFEPLPSKNPSNVMSAVADRARFNYGHVLSRDSVLDIVSRSSRIDVRRTAGTSAYRLATVGNLWTLFQQHEFLAFKLFDHANLFPKIVGTCGHFYAVEYLAPVSEFVQYDWKTRLNAALGIVELLDELESRFDEPLRACDLKLEHFGLTDRRAVRILDADNVYLQSAVKTVVNPLNVCKSDLDCSLFDCKVSCNTERSVCNRTLNTNLQVVCERLFLPLSFWNSSVFLPHLLHSIPDGLRSKVTSLIAVCSHSVEPHSYAPSALARNIRKLV